MEPLIEREADDVALSAVVDAAARGDGGAVLVVGEAGIGKTRLLGLARARAQDGELRVLYATADEIESGVPLAGARALLAGAAREVSRNGPARLGVLALGGELADPSGPGSRSDQVVHALWWLIVELADERPLALFLDDAQWADELTLHLLRLIGRRAAEQPLALVVAARPAAPGRPHGMLAAERAFLRLEPAPLSLAGTARLLERTLGQAEPVAVVGQVRAATGGNPLYLSELAHHARAGGGLADGRAPPQLVRIIRDRLERLSPAAGALARAVAVLGADAEPGRARELARLEPALALAAEEELRAERVLGGDAYAFVHPLVAEAARAGIGAVDGSELHARAAALLIRDGLDDQHVAEHLMAAPPRGDPDVAATLRRAAEAARRLGALPATARMLARALAEPPPLELVGALEFERGRALLDGGAAEGAGALALVARRPGDVASRIDAARYLARHFALEGRGEDAVALLRSVLDAARSADRETRLELVAELAFVGTSIRGGLEAARRTIAPEAARVTGRTPAERLVAIAAQVVSGAAPPDPAAAARQVLALRLHRDFPGGYAVGELTFAATMLLLNADALEDAEHAMDVLRADAEAMALPQTIAAALWQQAQIAYQRGDLARCELEARAAIETGGDFGARFVTPWRVMVLAEQGRLDDAEGLLGAAGMLGPIGPSGLLHAAVGCRGRLRLAQGDAHAAVDDLEDARDRTAAFFAERIEPPWQPLLAEALVLDGRSSDAGAEAAAYAKLAERWGTRRALGHLARMRALVAPRAAAIVLLEEAGTHFAASPARLELARSLTELGARRRAHGERRAARAILRDAHDAAHACQATALCDRARAELLLAGGRPRPPAGAGVDALTPAERRVAEIAAQGAGNREIARRLYLSPKTVEMHLRSAYRKLDLAGRDGLAAALH